MKRVTWALFNKHGIAGWREKSQIDPAQWADKGGRADCARFDTAWPADAPHQYKALVTEEEAVAARDETISQRDAALQAALHLAEKLAKLKGSGSGINHGEADGTANAVG